MSDSDSNDDNKGPSMDPLEGMGDRANEAMDEYIAKQAAKRKEEAEESQS